MPAQHHRLQIATRIHYVLMRELGQGIDVEQMLKRERYARDVLLVCEACRGTELAELARQFRAVTAELPELTVTVAPAAPGRQARAMDWSADTSGFGADPLETGLGLTGTPQQAPARAAAPRRAAPRRRWWERLMGR